MRLVKWDGVRQRTQQLSTRVTCYSERTNSLQSAFYNDQLENPAQNPNSIIVCVQANTRSFSLAVTVRSAEFLIEFLHPIGQNKHAENKHLAERTIALKLHILINTDLHSTTVLTGSCNWLNCCFSLICQHGITGDHRGTTVSALPTRSTNYKTKMYIFWWNRN